MVFMKVIIGKKKSKAYLAHQSPKALFNLFFWSKPEPSPMIHEEKTEETALSACTNDVMTTSCTQDCKTQDSESISSIDDKSSNNQDQNYIYEKDLPPNVPLIEGGGKRFVMINDKELQVLRSHSTLGKRILKFKNGDLVPKDTPIIHEGKKRFTMVQGEKIEVLTANALTGQRLKFKDGSLVPHEIPTFDEHGKHFATLNGEVIEVFTASALCARRLKFTDGRTVPKDTPIREKIIPLKTTLKSRYFATIINSLGLEVEVEVFTANTLGHYRLKFRGGRDVPKNIVTYYEGDRNFALIKNDEGIETPVEVFTAIERY